MKTLTKLIISEDSGVYAVRSKGVGTKADIKLIRNVKGFLVPVYVKKPEDKV